MEILLDQKTIIPLLIGAALALLGGIITQFISWRISLSHAKEVLIIAFRAELKIIRENIGTSLSGYRLSLLDGTTPRPNVFATQTPVFNANAGHLGQLRDSDLVEHIVEVYSTLHGLTERSASFSNIPSAAIELRDLNEIHMGASITHVQVMNLHNRLTGVPTGGQTNLNDSEVESREHLLDIDRHLKCGEIDVILNKRWCDV